jgi:thioredoxin 1
MIAPKVVQFSKDYPDVRFYKLDVDQVTNVASGLGVSAMPTFFFFRGGEKVGEVVGAKLSAIKVCI